MRVKILILIAILTVVHAGIALCGDPLNLEMVERKYGKAMIEDLRRLNEPPVGRQGLVSPELYGRNGAHTPQERVYSEWIRKHLGEQYSELNLYLNRELGKTAGEPPIREMERFLKSSLLKGMGGVK